MMHKIVFLITLYIPASVAAQDIATDRPDQTETPFVIPRKTIQLECGFLHEKEGRLKNVEIPSLLWRISLSEVMELRLITTHVNNNIRNGKHEYDGLEPVQLGFKIKVCEEKGLRPNVGYIQHVVIKWLASDNLEASAYTTNFRFAAQHSLCNRLNLSYNAGMKWEPGRSSANFIYTLATGFAITDKLSAYVEIFGTMPEKEKSVHNFDGGLTYLLLPNLQLDISAGAGFKNSSENYFLSTGISWRFSAKKISN